MDAMYHKIKDFMAEGGTLAVATIVSALGSTPREVGAKMAVTSSGEIAGTVGGGCGEAEVLREAVQVIRTRKPKTVRVELLDEIESDSPAVCGGVMNIFVDPWWKDPGTKICEELTDELIRIIGAGEAAVIVTVIDAGKFGEPGEKCLIHEGRIKAGNIRNEILQDAVLKEAATRLRREECRQVALSLPGTDIKVEVFFEIVPALRKAVIVGAGHLAVPLVKFAKILGFHVTVIDDRVIYANRGRFPDADEILAGDMAATLRSITITPYTYIVLITRGHQFDEPCLREVIHSPAKYIGMIGSKRRIKACFIRFRDEEGVPEDLLKKIHAPIGLDIKSETPEEIALSIVAEMVKVRRGGTARSISET
jgi:xanthine dehydrogenase accessory factor